MQEATPSDVFLINTNKEINPVTSTKRHKQRQRQQRSRWAMNEFETLEQYQNSIKEFNERTRLEFEDFIQKQGSDRNKLQLRCTPFTEKKGGYGSFDLDFGLQIWRHQQSKADELDRIIALRDQQLTEEIALSTKYVGKFDELQKRVDALTLALDQIAYPIPHMQKEAELNGCELNGYWAVKMSEDHTYSKDIARRALEKEQALKGG